MGLQLLLTSSIPHKNYTQTVSTLQALTGLRSPQVIATYTIVGRPHNVFKPKFEPGKVNQIEQYYMKCTTTWDDHASESLDLSLPVLPDSEINVDQLFVGKEVKYWTLHISDIPTAGKNTVLSQNFYESTLVHHHSCKPTPVVKSEPDDLVMLGENASMDTAIEKGGEAQDPHIIKEEEMIKEEDKNGDQPTAAEPESKDSFLTFLENLGYDVTNQYWLKGIRFFYGNIVIEMFKVLVRDDTALSQVAKIRLRALDESNTFQIKAYISFPKGASVDVITKGTKDLTALKATLHSLFELEVPDRMAMDSRVARAA